MRASTFASTAVLLLAASSAQAGTIDFSGFFPTDDTKVIFEYSVQNLGPVTVSTTSFAAGGFMPILSLFDASGNFLFLNTGYTNTPSSDATLSWNSDAGAPYFIVLTEYDNYPLLIPNNNLSDGFTEDGQGNFTQNLSGMSGPFHLPTGEQQTGYWAVSFTSPDPTLAATAVPEPAAGLLFVPGALLIGWLRKRRHPGSSASQY